jgi:hypothetical protein
MNSQLPKFRTIVLGVLILTAIPFMSTAEGATSRARGTLSKTLNTRSGEAASIYSASFQWNEGQSNSGQTLRIVITKNKKPRFSEPKLVTKIMNGKRVEALCSIQSAESYLHGHTLLASSIDMSCKGTALGALAASATLFFPEKLDGANGQSASRNKPVLRFGTWLQGYQQAVLKTEFDQSARLMSELKEIIRPGAEHVKLARAQ